MYAGGRRCDERTTAAVGNPCTTRAGLVSQRGAPRFLRSDNGAEFVSNAILKWIVESNIEVALIDPGKPWQNGTDESFNGKLRDECMSLEWFRSRREAKVVIDAGREHYNLVRPHSSLEYRTPIAQSVRQSSTSRKAGAPSSNRYTGERMVMPPSTTSAWPVT